MADTMIIQPGQPEGKDTWLNSANPNNNSGAGALLLMGFSVGAVRRILTEFTLPYPLTSGNLISVTLRLWCTLASPSDEPAIVRRCIRHTGFSGGEWQEDKATWNQFNNGLGSPDGDWTAAGGDFNALEVAQAFNLPTATGQFDITGVEMLAMAQGAISFQSRQMSLILMRTVEAGVVATANFASADNATASQHPQLIIEYKPFVRSGRPPMRRPPYEARMGRRPGSWRPAWRVGAA